MPSLPPANEVCEGYVFTGVFALLCWQLLASKAPPLQNPGSAPALTSLCNRCNLTLQIFSTVTATLSAEVLNVLSREKIQQIISTSGTHIKLVGETLESSSWSDIEKIYSLLAAEVSYVFFTDREGR